VAAVAAQAVCVSLVAFARVATAACPPSRTLGDPTSLPEAWRAELRALVEATRREGMPWACTGASIGLRVASDGRKGWLAIEDGAARRVEREVGSPAEVVPMGEALLAVPLPGPPASETPPAATPPARDATEPAASPAVARVGLSAGPRYAGASHAVTGAFGVRGALIFGEWTPGLSGRFDGPTHVLGAVPPGFSMWSFSAGPSLHRRILDDGVDLEAGVTASLVAMTMAGTEEICLERAGKNANAKGPCVARGTAPTGGTEIDGRVGLELRALFDLGASFALAASLDAELAPAAFAGAEARRYHPTLPPPPAYTLGLALGVERGF
jgi:hypothetical protein